MRTTERMILTLTSIFALAFAPPAFAEDDEDDHHLRRTPGEILEFLERHLPEPLEFLEEIRAEGDEDAEAEFFEEAGEFVGEYYNVREEFGSEGAEVFLRYRKTEMHIDRLLEEHDEAAERGDDEAVEIAAELKETLGEHINLRLEIEEAHLARAREELEEAARELEHAAANREAIIEEEFHNLLHGEEEDEGEEEEGEEEDEGDDEDEEEEDEGGEEDEEGEEEDEA